MSHTRALSLSFSLSLARAPRLASPRSLPVGELFALTSKSSRGDSGDALDRILPLVEARAEEGDLDLTAWASKINNQSFTIRCYD